MVGWWRIDCVGGRLMRFLRHDLFTIDAIPRLCSVCANGVGCTARDIRVADHFTTLHLHLPEEHVAIELGGDDVTAERNEASAAGQLSDDTCVHRLQTRNKLPHCAGRLGLVVDLDLEGARADGGVGPIVAVVEHEEVAVGELVDVVLVVPAVLVDGHSVAARDLGADEPTGRTRLPVNLQ